MRQYLSICQCIYLSIYLYIYIYIYIYIYKKKKKKKKKKKSDLLIDFVLTSICNFNLVWVIIEVDFRFSMNINVKEQYINFYYVNQKCLKTLFERRNSMISSLYEVKGIKSISIFHFMLPTHRNFYAKWSLRMWRWASVTKRDCARLNEICEKETLDTCWLNRKMK